MTYPYKIKNISNQKTKNQKPMLAEGLNSEVVDATNSRCKSIPFSDLGDTCIEKNSAARKYQRNSKEKRVKQRMRAVLDQQYEDLVADINRLRLASQDPSKSVKKLDRLKKKQKKMRQRVAQIQSGTSLKQYGCALLDGLHAIIQYMETLREVVGEEVLRFLLDLFTTLYNVFKNPEWTSLLLNFTSFFSRHFPKDYAEYAILWLKTAFNVAFAQDDKTSYKDFILKMFDNSTNFLNDCLWSNICDFFVKLATLYGAVVDAVSFEAIDLETILKQFNIFKKTLPEVKDVIEMAFMAYEFTLGHWENIRTGDWTKLLLGKDETQEFEMEVRFLEQAFTLVLSNKETELMDRYKLTKDKYEVRLSSAIKKAKSLVSRCTSTQQKMSVSNFIRTLTEKQAQLFASIADAPRKLEAYSVKFSGPSGSGKSALLNICSKIILNAYGFDANERGQVVFTNISEKFESTIFPSHKLICADDVANNANEKPNYDRILNYVNTVPRPLEKADTKEKGVFYPGNCGFMATTNDETLRAMQCSSCPESILRRFALDVTVEIREEFRNSYGGIIKLKKPRYDVYKLTLKRFSHIETDGEGKSLICWDVIPRCEWNPTDDGTKDFAAMCKFLTKDVRNHIVEQKAKAESQKMLDECTFCGECGCPSMICICNDQNEEKDCNTVNSEMIDDDDIPNLEFHKELIDDSDSDEEDDEMFDFSELQRRANEMDDDEDESIDAVAQFGSIWSSFSTSELWDYRAAIAGSREATMNLYRRGALWSKIFRHRKELQSITMRIFGALFLGCLISPKLAQPIVFSQMLYGVILYQRMIKEVENELANRVDRLSSLCVGMREHLRTNMKKYFGVGAAIIALYQGYKIVKPLMMAQDKSSYYDDITSLFSKTLKSPKDEKLQFVTQDERDYKEGYSRIAPKETAISKTTTSSDLQKALAKALRVVIVKSKGKVFGNVNGVLIASNVILIPSHAVPDTYPIDVETSTTPGVPNAKTKDQKLTEESCYVDREHDFALIHLASSPAGTNFSQFFPEDYPTFYSRSTTLVWKGPDNKMIYSEQAARGLSEDLHYHGRLEKEGHLFGTRQEMHKYTLKKGKGLRVDFPDFNGFAGLCGGMYLDAVKGIIYGFHVAGYHDSNAGFLTCITQDLIRKGMDKLKKTSPTMLVHSASEVRVDTYGLPYTVVNAPPNYLREDGTQSKSVVTYFGKVLKEGQPLENRARAPYVKTPFKGVSEQFGECKHRPPKDPNDIAKGMKTLNKLTNPVQHYEGDILKRAIDDYKEQTLSCVRENRAELSSVLRIYSQEEAMDGIGEFGLGGLPNDTSAGFPINKSKKQCLVRDPFDESLVKVPREFNDKFDIQGEIDRTEECWKQGYRSEAIYKASSKVNELLPKKKAVEKVRKFYGSGFANFVSSRKALGGVPRFMRKFWKTTECLVGINPTSREWDDFHEYLTEYSTTNMIAGDFSGFDTRMAAQITGGAAKIILSWYEEIGCSEEDLNMVRGALSDIIHPNIIFDGDLYRFANGNPSGNLITVQLNSICNSIMMRYVYYAMMPSVRESFANNVRLGTFGDDNAMSVKKHCRWYNHTSCKEEFEKLDIGYTMAEKEADSVPYITIDEISFLKRSFRKHDTLDRIVAPIEEDSTLKKFFWIKKPNETPLSPAEQFGAYTDGAFRDMYLRGRVEYEAFMMKIQNIVRQNPELRSQISFIPYEEMTQVVSPFYMDDYVNNNKKLFAESCGIDSEDLGVQV